MSDVMRVAYYVLVSVVVVGGFAAWVCTLWGMTKR